MLQLVIYYVTIFFLIFGTYAADTPQNNMVVLGDSYTADSKDNCNGPKWIRELGKTWNNVSIQNFAVGGACCRNQNHSPSPSVIEQADEYLASNPKTNPSTTIYSIFVGINDLVAGEATKDVVSCIESQIVRLNSEVQGSQFMVFNMVPFDRSPRITEGGETNNATTWIKQFNQELNTKASDMSQQHPDMQIVVVDTHSTLNKVLENPQSYGITKNVDDYYTRSVPNPEPDTAESLGDGNQYFWFDTAHITSVVQEQISKAVVDQDPFANIPLTDSNAPPSGDDPSSAASTVQHRSFVLLAFIVGVALLL